MEEIKKIERAIAQGTFEKEYLKNDINEENVYKQI
jgi:hypothetical protein